MAEKLRVLSVYDGFFTGGARILHTEVVTSLQKQGNQEHVVLSIHESVEREETVQHMEDDRSYQDLIAAGVAVTSLGRQLRLGEAVQPPTNEEIAQLETAMGQADIILSLKEQPLTFINQAERGETPLLVTLHRSDPENQGAGATALRQTVALGRAAYVCCAYSAKEAYSRLGMPPDTLHVVTNGIDLERFVPSEKRRREVRAELGIPEDDSVVLLAARYDEMKNIPLFLKSARYFLKENDGAYAVLCGSGMTAENAKLGQMVKEAFGDMPHLQERIRFLGVRKDMERIHAAADIISLTSKFGEAYPLSLAEGMACGAIPVATDVGDVRTIIQDAGIVTSADPSEVALAWKKAMRQKAAFQEKVAAVRPAFDREKMAAAYKHIIERYARRGAYERS